MYMKKSSAQTKSSYGTFSNNLLKEQNGCDNLSSTINKENAVTNKTWKVTRSYLGHFSCEDAVKTIIKSHMNTEEEHHV